VAETAAKRDLEVAIMNARAAEQRKLAAILEAEGISKSTKMKMEADNYRAMGNPGCHRYSEVLGGRLC